MPRADFKDVRFNANVALWGMCTVFLTVVCSAAYTAAISEFSPFRKTVSILSDVGVLCFVGYVIYMCVRLKRDIRTSEESFAVPTEQLLDPTVGMMHPPVAEPAGVCVCCLNPIMNAKTAFSHICKSGRGKDVKHLCCLKCAYNGSFETWIKEHRPCA